MDDLDKALQREAAKHAVFGETLRHVPSGLVVTVLLRKYENIFVEFPKGAQMHITLDKLEAM